MGAYRFVQAQMLDLFGVNPKYVGRPDSATPAVGSTKAHEKQAHALLVQVFPSMATEKKEDATISAKADLLPNEGENQNGQAKQSNATSGRKPAANKR